MYEAIPQTVEPESNHQDVAPEVKLEYFVEKFVSIFEKQLSEYYDRVDVLGGEQKAGKTADLFKNLVKLVKPVSKLADPLTKVGVIIGLKVTNQLIDSVGSKNNRDSTKKLFKILYFHKSEPKKVKKELIKAGIKIFQCFEEQFTQVTANGVWQNAMDKLAADAVSRVINNFKSETEEAFTSAGITKGLIKGKSKLYKLSNIFKGHTLNSMDSEVEWNTAELFEQTGLIVKDGAYNMYYNGKKSNAHKFGYRLLFEWESKDESYFTTNGYEQLECLGEDYTYKTNATDIDKLVDKLSEKLSKDKGQNKLSEELLTQIKTEADDLFKLLEGFATKNFAELKEQLKNGNNEIEKLFVAFSRELEQNFDEASQQRKEIAENLVEIKKHQENIGKALEKQPKERAKRKPIWFDVEEPVTSFVDRKSMLNDISEKLKTGIVVICGLSGIGKTELAKKYAQVYCKDYENNVIWINAQNEESVQKSFERLAKGSLKIKMKYEEGDEKSLDVIVREVYEYFDHKSLFVFDSADKFDSFKPFLPKLPPGINNPDVLITSQNESDWKNDKKQVWPLSLDNLTDDEAIQLVKNILETEENSQTKYLEELVKNLYNFPLALNQASHFIKDKQKLSDYSLADFIKEFTKAPKKLQKDKYLGTVFNTLKFILDRITNPKSLELLNYISYFESNRIPKKLLNSLMGGKFAVVIKDLVKYSIVRIEGDTVSVHGLVQKACRLMLEENKEAVSTQSKALKILNNLIKQFDKRFSLRPHVLSIWNHTYKNDSLIETFIINDIVGMPPHINFFHYIASGSTFEVFKTILAKIESKFSDNFENVIFADDGRGGLPVHYAASNKDPEIMQLLIEKRAQINVIKRGGLWNPLHFAIQNGNHKVVNVLLVANIQIDATTEFKFTSVHLAARNGHSEIVEMLVRFGADVNAVCKRKFTPLHFAAKMNHCEVVQTLLDSPGIVINAVNEYQLTPLHFAVKSGCLDCVKLLLQKGANPNAKDIPGNFTPLHIAACNGHKEIVVEILKFADVGIDFQTTRGNTSLHMAAEKGYLEIVEVLTMKNAKLDIKNEEGKLACELADAKKFEKVVDYLKNKNNNKLESIFGKLRLSK
jgi:ankyrin repeat protein/energy-coupling factor transporter ATP-binding protein EcfA2